MARDTPFTGLSTHHSVQSCCLEFEPGDHALGRGVPHSLRIPRSTGPGTFLWHCVPSRKDMWDLELRDG